MASLNLCQFIGNAGRDAELRYTASGAAMAQFSLAVNGRRKNASGEWEDQTEWVNAVLFGERAEKVSQYITKGTKVYISGRLNTRSWDDDKGQKHYRTEIAVNDVQLLGERQGGESRTRQSQPSDDDLPFE